MDNLTNYRIRVKTGDRFWAGTEANVSLQLYGTERDSAVFPLLVPLTADGPFRRGQTDQFLFPGVPSVGKLRAIRISHDNSAVAYRSDWFLDDVEVMEEGEDIIYRFLCNRWLSANKEDLHTSVVIMCQECVEDLAKTDLVIPTQEIKVEGGKKKKMKKLAKRGHMGMGHPGMMAPGVQPGMVMYGQPQPGMGVYGRQPGMGIYGQPGPPGMYGQPGMGMYGRQPGMGMYGQPGYHPPAMYGRGPGMHAGPMMGRPGGGMMMMGRPHHSWSWSFSW